MRCAPASRSAAPFIKLLGLGLAPAASLLIGCSGDDELDCSGLQIESCDIRSEDCQRATFNAIRCIRDGVNSGPRPSVSFMSEDEVFELFTDAASEIEVDEETALAQNALSMLGLTQPGMVSAGATVDVSLDGLLGFYAAESNAIVVLESEDIDFAGQRATTTLAHEYVHSLQHFDFDLENYRNRISEGFDFALAATTIIEGEATLNEKFFEAELEGLPSERVDWEDYYRQLTNAADTYAVETPHPADIAFGLFPYTYGGYESFSLWSDGGAAALAGLRESSKPTTYSALAARHSSGSEAEQLSPVDGSATPRGFELVGENSLGAWLTHGFVVHSLGREESPDLALHWRGDLLTVYGSETVGAGAIWSIRWSSPEQAERFVLLVSETEPPAGGIWAAHRAGALSHLAVVDATPEVLSSFTEAAGLAPGEVAEPVEIEDAGAPPERNALRRLLLRSTNPSCLLPFHVEH